METEFIYWRHATPAGIMVDEICGAEDKSPAVWRAMARQIYGENGKDFFREIDHSDIGAPLLCNSQRRISISHTERFLVVAELPPTPEANLNEFSLRTAMGIDAEPQDRDQVLKIRQRVFSPQELEMIDAESVELNVLGWTCKEALYKAALLPGLDFRKDLKIIQLPKTMAFPGALRADLPLPYGRAEINRGGEIIEMQLYSYRSEGHIVTLAYSPKCAKYSARK